MHFFIKFQAEIKFQRHSAHKISSNIHRNPTLFHLLPVFKRIAWQFCRFKGKRQRVFFDFLFREFLLRRLSNTKTVQSLFLKSFQILTNKVTFFKTDYSDEIFNFTELVA